MKRKDFISLNDFSSLELKKIIDLAFDLKKKQKTGKGTPLLKGKTLAMLFEKPSTRTRVSFEIGMYQLGGYAVNLSPRAVQMGEREETKDVARTLSRYVDAIMVRTFEHSTVLELARYATVPIINGLSDLEHPCQALADVMTILEKKRKLKGLKLAYIGDGNNVCHSLMYASEKFGMQMKIACPVGYSPKIQTSAEVVHDPFAAVKGADIVYTDVWASMGQEEEEKERKKIFEGFQVNQALVKTVKPDYIFMHCLPAHRGEEVSNKVIDSRNSVVFDQAENRLHLQKAILVSLLK